MATRVADNPELVTSFLESFLKEHTGPGSRWPGFYYMPHKTLDDAQSKAAPGGTMKSASSSNTKKKKKRRRSTASAAAKEEL